MITAYEAFRNEKWIDSLIDIKVPYDGKEPIKLTYTSLVMDEIEKVGGIFLRETDPMIKSQIFCIVGLVFARVVGELDRQHSLDVIETERTYQNILTFVLLQGNTQDSPCYKIALFLLLHFYGKQKNEELFNSVFAMLN